MMTGMSHPCALVLKKSLGFMSTASHPQPMAMAHNSNIKWAEFQANRNLPVTEFSGIRWQWQVDSHTGQQMWFAINWLQDAGPMATQLVEPVATATAEARGHQSEAMGCYV